MTGTHVTSSGASASPPDKNSVGRWSQIIAHADMDAFYASVEQMDDPRLRGRPILVGSTSGRGVVLTASYEARHTGVGSAMPMVKARRLCPQALIVPPRFARYAELSGRIMQAFTDFSPHVEAISLDEAFLEMTGSEHIFGSPEQMANRIREAIHEATGGLTASVGISGTKYVAKVASALNKPDAITVVPPDKAAAWLAPLSISRLWGAGPKTQARLKQLGFHLIGDLAVADPDFLKARLGSLGMHFYALANAQDPRSVARSHRARSLSSDRTLEHDISDPADIRRHLRRSADRVGTRLKKNNYLAGGVRVKLKTTDFQSLTRQRLLNEPSDVADVLYETALSLLPAFASSGPFRLVGLAAHDLIRADGPEQGDLFNSHQQSRELEKTIDALNQRFGKNAVRRARDIDSSTVLGDHASDLDFLR
ncbi:MAG: DNA polymerase IV [Proteobacteria bacterium]|nr:DNA polymerase IV [Pseudomonadota bacterium]